MTHPAESPKRSAGENRSSSPACRSDTPADWPVYSPPIGPFDSLTADAAIVGDSITYGARPSFVLEHCECVSYASYCLPCRQRLATLYSLELHVHAAGFHRIARECPIHGLEAWALTC
jgi:hypothetical protein